MKIKSVLLSFVGLLMLAPALAQNGANQNQASVASFPFLSVSVDEFAKVIASDSAVLVDVRTAKEYAEGHLVNSRNVDVLSPDFASAIQSLPKDKTIAVYCRSGRRSKNAALILTKNNFKVVELDKGYLAWTAAGKPVVK